MANDKTFISTADLSGEIYILKSLKRDKNINPLCCIFATGGTI
jgi:hypothetical protein